MTDDPQVPPRRAFLKLAGALAATSAVGCTLESHPPDSGSTTAIDREVGFDRAILDAVGEAVLPEELGAKGRDVAIGAFVAWADGYVPVAEEMHGYGYSDIRYLPPDPAPGWRAQLAALDVLARKSLQRPFARIDVAARRELLSIALKGHGGERLPAPLDATHVAIALLAHWAASPDAWDLVWNAKITPSTCRVLGDANSRPIPITGLRA
jgi:hypothetical protein